MLRPAAYAFPSAFTYQNKWVCLSKEFRKLTNLFDISIWLSNDYNLVLTLEIWAVQWSTLKRRNLLHGGCYIVVMAFVSKKELDLSKVMLKKREFKLLVIYISFVYLLSMCGYYLKKQAIQRRCNEEPPQRKILAGIVGLWQLSFVVQNPIRWMCLEIFYYSGFSFGHILILNFHSWKRWEHLQEKKYTKRSGEGKNFNT